MRERLGKLRESGYLAAAIVAVCIVFLAWSLAPPIRLWVAIVGGGALVGLVRWEAASEANHRLVLRFAAVARRLWLAVVLLAVLLVVLAKCA